MTERKIYAEITLDDDAAIEEGMGSIDYVEREFGWLLDSGITLENAIIADDDDSDTWARYVNYVIGWAMSNTYNENPSGGPMSYEQWNKKEENKND